MAHALIILCNYYRVVATTQVHLCCAAPLRTRTYRWRYDRADRGVGSCPLGARAPSRALPCVYLLRSRGRHGSNYHGMGQQRAPRYGTLSESECVRLHASCMHLAKVVACSRQSVLHAQLACILPRWWHVRANLSATPRVQKVRGSYARLEGAGCRPRMRDLIIRLRGFIILSLAHLHVVGESVDDQTHPLLRARRVRTVLVAGALLAATWQGVRLQPGEVAVVVIELDCTGAEVGA